MLAEDEGLEGSSVKRRVKRFSEDQVEVDGSVALGQVERAGKLGAESQRIAAVLGGVGVETSRTDTHAVVEVPEVARSAYRAVPPFEGTLGALALAGVALVIGSSVVY